MDPNAQDELQKALGERFAQLPPVVQRAILSSDVEKNLRALADSHRLHIDQWQLLQNEVMLTLLGFQPVEDLEKNLRGHVNVSDIVARSLAEDISRIVFQPIREELERQLEHPDAKAAEKSGVEEARAQVIGEAGAPPGAPAAPAQTPAIPVAPVIPATPPAPPPAGKIERAPISAAYKAGETSAARKSIEDDPYREPPA